MVERTRLHTYCLALLITFMFYLFSLSACFMLLFGILGVFLKDVFHLYMYRDGRYMHY